MIVGDIMNYAGFAVGILGIILSIYFFLKGKEVKDPRCYFKTYETIAKLSDEHDSKIKIKYGRNEVSRIFTTYVWVWNGGKKPINKVDIPPQSNLKLSLQDDVYSPKILDFKVVKMSRPGVNFSAIRDGETSLIFDFDFLDYNDGAVLEIQHTGSSETKIVTEGIILGVPDGISIQGNNQLPVMIRVFSRAFSVFEKVDITKKPITFFAISAILIVFALCGFGYSYYLLTEENTWISMPISEFETALSTEFPQITEQNVSNIINALKPKETDFSIFWDKYSKIFFLVFTGAFMYIFLCVIYADAKRSVIKPYPKNLFHEDSQKKP